jgi:hypothetical protein
MPYNKDNLNCFVPDSFRLKASKTGPLTMRSFVVKDNIAVSGHTSSFGHPRWRDTHPKSTFTAPVVTRMLQARADMEVDLFAESINLDLNQVQFLGASLHSRKLVSLPDFCAFI